jgi:hypothetical protein
MVVKITGGGYGSRKVSHSREGKQEPKARAVSPAAVAQQGAATQFRKEELYRGKGYQTPKGVTDPTKVGPGAGRTIHRSGSQSATPPAREMPEGRNTLAEYGPEVPGKRGI